MKKITAFCLATAASCAFLSPAHATGVFLPPTYYYSYEFESSTSDTGFNGSTITIEGIGPNYSLYSYNLYDNDAPSPWLTDLSGANSFVDSASISAVYNNGFTGSFDVSGEHTVGRTYYSTTIDGNSAGSYATMSASYATGPAGAPAIVIDPPGSWTLTGNTGNPLPNAVPDTTETLWLLLLAGGGLAAARHRGFAPAMYS